MTTFFLLLHLKANRKLNKLQFEIPFAQYWLLYLLVATVGLLWALDPAYSADEIKHEILFPLCFFLLGYHLIGGQSNVKIVCKLILLGNLFAIATACIKFFLAETVNPNGTDAFLMGVGNFSTYLITSLPLALLATWVLVEKRFRSPAIVGVLGMNCLGLYLSANRQSWVALFFELLLMTTLFIGHVRPRIIIATVLGASIVISLVFVAQNHRRTGANGLETVNITGALEKDGRIATWKLAIGASLETPLTGGGIGRDTFIRRFPEYAKKQEPFAFRHAHNVLIDKLLQLGIPGLIAFVALFVALCHRLIKQAQRSEQAKVLGITGLAICIGVLLKNMTDEFFFRELCYLFWLYIGIVLAWQKRLESETL